MDITRTRRIKQIFDQNVLAKLSENIEYDDVQLETVKEWIGKIKRKSLISETRNYDNFRENVLVRILKYDRDKLSTSAAHVGSEPDFKLGMELCIEVKGQNTDLFGPQHRKNIEYETPILQATLYKGQGYKNSFCTNYREFVLIGESSRYHVFDFMDMECDDGSINIKKLQEFLYLFSQDYLIERKSSDKLVAETIMLDHNITKKFYDLFDETRKLLVKDISKNASMTHARAMIFAQTILNRLVFILFVEDRQMTGDVNFFRNQTLNILKNYPTSKSRGVWDMIKNRLFVYFNEGNDEINIPSFNGGLFATDIPENVWFTDIDETTVMRKNIKNDDAELEEILKKYSVNPIIVNMIEMTKYDFANQLGPNLLGNIFEKSMSALENVGVEGDLLRKTTGAYYTLENVTSYICRNTIIPYLSKNGNAKNTAELVYEYTSKANIDILEKKLEKLRILDPSCGSGAFLTKAVDVLLDIHQQIHEYKKNRDLYQNKNGISLDNWTREEESRKIIEKNLFGIDLNTKAVEIAKLSLSFKIASKGNQLPDLSSYIVDGNTLNVTILDYNDEKFLEIKTLGGFDIIIGNPPYVEKSKLNYEANVSETKACGNTFAYFFEKGFNLLKPGGRIGYIVPVASISTPRMTLLQKFLVVQSAELKISSYDDRPGKLFEGLNDCRTSIILCIKKASANDGICKIFTTGYNRWHTSDVGSLFKNLSYINNDQKTKSYIPKLNNETELSIFKKIFKHKDSKNKKETKEMTHTIIYHDAPRYWIRGQNFVPYFSKNGKKLLSTHDKKLFVKDDNEATIMIGLLNSSLFYWFYIKTSNCRDLTKNVIDDFPLDLKWNQSELKMIKKLTRELMADYKKNALIKTTNNKRTGVQEKETFYVRKSKHIIDKIDDALATHYNLNDDETKYIKNFDLVFRMQE